MKKIFIIPFLAIVLLMFNSERVSAALPTTFSVTQDGTYEYDNSAGLYAKYAGIRVAWLKGSINGSNQEIYCIEYSKNAPSTSCTYTKTSNYIDDPGILSIINYDNTKKTDRYVYHLKEAVLYKYFLDRSSSKIFNGGTKTASGVGLDVTGRAVDWTKVNSETSNEAKQVLALANAAKSVETESSLTVSSNPNENSKCLQGEYVVSPQITVYGTNVDLSAATISVSQGTVVNKNISGSTMTFNVQMPLSSLKDKTNVTVSVSVTSSKQASKFYIYKANSGCVDNVGNGNIQNILLSEPESTTITKSTTVTLDPAVCNLSDYTIDAACTNCNDTSTDSDRATYFIQDTTDWEAILKSDDPESMCEVGGLTAEATSQKLANYFVYESSCGKIYCREELRVVFPNANDTLTVERGRYFTVHSPFRNEDGTVKKPYSEVHYGQDVTILNTTKYDRNWGPITVEKTRQCRMKTSDTSNEKSCLSSSSSKLQFTDAIDVQLTYRGKIKSGATSEEKAEFSQYDDELTDLSLEVEGNDEFGNGNDESESIISSYFASEDEEIKSNYLYATTQAKTYKLPGTHFRYILKDGGIFISERPGDGIYIDLGIATIPVSQNNVVYSGGADAQIELSFDIGNDMHLSDSFVKNNNYLPNCADASQSSSLSNIYGYAITNGSVSSTGVSGLTEADKIEYLAKSACSKMYGCNQTSSGISCKKSGVNTCISDRTRNKIGSSNNCYTSSQGNSYICSVYVDPGIPTIDLVDKEDCPGCIDPSVDPDYPYNNCPGCTGSYGSEGGTKCVAYIENGGVCIPQTGYNKLIYRPIDLTNPFPAQTGNNRKTGVNWCGYNETTKKYTCLWNESNPVVSEYILNNRGVKGDAVYQLQPMYSVTLDPQTIEMIQAYNSTKSYDDFTLRCNEYGEECKLGQGFSSYVDVNCSITGTDPKCERR